MAKKSNNSEKDTPSTATAAGGNKAIPLCKEDADVVCILLKGIYTGAEKVKDIAPLIMHIISREMAEDLKAGKCGEIKGLKVTTPKKGKDKLLATLDLIVGMKTFTAKYSFEGGERVIINYYSRHHEQ